jgi:predicted unusual protein kinase regulating ubiquinone biosynthesis (AarF/ABC1/UbiB family)
VNRNALARRLVYLYLKQVLEAGFFHADPHPGNIFVQPGPSGTDPTVALVDFGMVGSLTRSTKQGLKDLFLGFVVNNPHAMVNALQRLGFIGEGANIASIERGVGLMMEQYHGMSMGEVSGLRVGEVAREIEDLFYRQPFHVPAQFAFAGRAIGTLSGLATGLAHEFSLVAVAIPYAQKFLGLSRDNATQNAQQLLQQLVDASRTMLTLPQTLERVLTRIETGQLELRLAEDGVSRTGRGGVGRGRRRGSGRSILLGLLVFAASLGAGTVLLLNQVVIAGWFCLALAALATISLLFLRR